MARLRNPAEPVVALLAVLGSRIVEVLVTKTQITGGLRAWRPANVSPNDLGRESDCYSVVLLVLMTNARL